MEYVDTFYNDLEEAIIEEYGEDSEEELIDDTEDEDEEVMLLDDIMKIMYARGDEELDSPIE